MHEEVLCQDPALDTQRLLREKAVELFAQCDKECKGFITRRDLLRLTRELPLTADVLEEVFDRLDDDGNGYLSLEEFTDGFGQFLSYVQGHENDDPEEVAREAAAASKSFQTGDGGTDESDQFEQMLYQIKGHEVMRDPNCVKEIWRQLRGSDPASVALFEDFISKMVQDMRKTVSEQRELEEALKTRSVLHDEELSKLYEEMETQIEMERQRVKRQEQEREFKLRQDLSEEMSQKEKQLQELINKKNSLAEQVRKLQGLESNVREENELLIRKNEELEEAVRKLNESYVDTQQYLKHVKDQINQEKRERAKAALKVNESIAKERSTLVQQLDELREENKMLKDERDELASFKESVGFIENLLKQVQDKGTVDVTSSEDEEEDSANDASDVASQKSDCDQDQEVGEKDTVDGGEEQTLQIAVPQINFESVEEVGAGQGSRMSQSQSNYEMSSEQWPNVDGNNFDKENEVGVKRKRSFSLHRNLNAKAKVPQKNKIRKSKKSSKKQDGKVGGALDKPKSMSKEALSSNLSALLSSNELNLTSLQIPNGNESQRRGSVIGSYMKPGESSQNGSDEDEFECELLPDGTDAKTDYEVNKQLFLQNGHSNQGINWNRRESERSMESVNLNSTLDLSKLGQKSFDENQNSDMIRAISEDRISQQSMHFQELRNDAMVDITQHRVFKVVFVGDSGVGKSSFISRVCKDQFLESLQATVGVDYHVKQLFLDNVCYSLQFWDTAGQERYRSITKQYFRRTDAIVVMYDVCSERSLLNVRNWVEEIKQEIEDDILLFIIGSKLDLKFNHDLKVNPIDSEEGKALASRCGGFFAEVSSRTGEGISESVQLLAQELAKLEDKEMEDAKNIILKEKKKQKSGCC